MHAHEIALVNVEQLLVTVYSLVIVLQPQIVMMSQYRGGSSTTRALSNLYYLMVVVKCRLVQGLHSLESRAVYPQGQGNITYTDIGQHSPPNQTVESLIK